jgi:predicted amidophosphoribosyltransferase
MFCPLCQSEYREGVTHCTDCRAALVAALDSPESRANPPRLLWRAPIAELYKAISNRLEEDGIPCRAIEQDSPLLRNIRPHFEIQVLASDFDRALKAGIDAVESINPLQGWFESCPACGAQQPAGFSRCAVCNAWLLPAEIVSTQSSSQSQDSAAAENIVQPLGKHCNLCSLIYQVKFTHCSACGNLLSDGLIPTIPQSDREALEPLTIVWKGDDPVALSRIVCVLRRAAIRAFVKSSEDHLVFGLGMPRPRYEVNVFQSDYQVARYFVLPIRETLPFDWLAIQEATPEVVREAAIQNAALEASESAAPSSAPDADLNPQRPPTKSSGKWSPARATVEIWSGDDSGIAAMLASCLAENRIAFRCEGTSPATQHFYVIPEESAHAGEIVSAIVDSVSQS